MLKIEDLRTYLYTDEGVVKAVDGVNLELQEGEVLGLVGESGCGKSMTALSILRLIPSPPGKIVSGRINFEGVNLLELDERRMRQVRGGQISIVFQEPGTSLNPVWKIGDQIEEAIMIHQQKTKTEAKEETLRLLKLVGISSPEERFSDYPHQLSGGMRQRVMLAMAISSKPKILIADEPTTALDVTIQAQILDLLMELKNKMGMSLLFITHDFGIVSEITDRVAVMYAGRIIEMARREELFINPLHPYTRALLDVFPGQSQKEFRGFKSIPGEVPHLAHLPSGCYFSPRCRRALDICRREFPPMKEINKGHWVSCWNPIRNSRLQQDTPPSK